MPYGLFDFEDTIQPMGLSPAYEPQWDSEAFYNATQLKQGIAQGIAKPAPTPENTGMVTRAIPENPPQQMMTQAIPENPPSGNPTTLAYGENGAIPAPAPVPNPVTTAMIGNEAPPTATKMYPESTVTPNPIMTMAIPESGVIPTPPSGQCPTGYQSSSQSSSAPVKPPSAGYQFYDGGKQYQVGSGLGTNVLKSSGSGGGTSTMPVRSPVSATAPSTWSGSQQQYTSMLNQLGINTAR